MTKLLPWLRRDSTRPELEEEKRVTEEKHSEAESLLKETRAINQKLRSSREFNHYGIALDQIFGGKA